MDTKFHRGLKSARALSQLASKVFEDAVGHGRCSIDDVLGYEYREIKGAEIQTLARLFDVRRVPSQGFTPPKYSTRYDSVVDLDLQRVMEQIKHRDPTLTFATVVDLNLYMPIHHPEFCQGWTGDAAKDIADNRIKRFFHDKWLTTDAARVGPRVGGRKCAQSRRSRGIYAGRL
jgi:hypothetical protein